MNNANATLRAAGAGPPDDPWYWTVERVVKELCTPDRVWEPEPDGYFRQLPASIDLERRLRDKGINGEALLCDMTDQFMREDLGLVAVAWMDFVRTAIESLRRRSVRYIEYQLAELDAL
jgi:hypothetical protein